MVARMEADSSETRDASDLQASESRAHEMYTYFVAYAIIIYIFLSGIHTLKNFTK